MLRRGYEVAAFLAISGPIDRSPKAYDLAFAHNETDAVDLTYFVDHQLNLMEAALQDLLDPLTHCAARLRELTMPASARAVNTPVLEGKQARRRRPSFHDSRCPDAGGTRLARRSSSRTRPSERARTKGAATPMPV
jgi:hypothetical protein